VIEDHLEAGFCSADCPVQHAGHTAAIAPPTAPSAGRRSPAAIIVGVRRANAARRTTDAPDAPRAPPAA
jgi:hypothetical protein